MQQQKKGPDKDAGARVGPHCDVNAVMGKGGEADGERVRVQCRNSSGDECRDYIRAAAQGDLISFVQLSQAG